MTPWPFPPSLSWIAHRGAGKTAPENTLLAFRTGLAAGFTAFECDVQLSRDGVPFLLHDDLLDRTTNGHGLACAQDWATLSQLDAGSWHGAASGGEPLMSLAALASLARSQSLHINLELKPSPGEATRVGAGVADWLRTHWRGPTPLLSSFEPEALRAAQGRGWPLALLLERWAIEAPQQALQLGACAVVCHHASLRAEGIAALHATGLRSLSYTVNDAAEAARLRAAGIDGLITDRLELPVALGQGAAGPA
jgi:glycerophosphoryl diester phosphodiesterase